MWRLFCHCLFLISPSFGASGKLWFLIMGILTYNFAQSGNNIELS